MPPYLRFTLSSPRIIRETTTGRARRAGPPRVRRRQSDARAAVATRDARAVHVGREGERREAHGHPLGHGARARGRVDEVRRAAAATRGHPEVSQPRGLPRDRRPAPGPRTRQPAALPRRRPAAQRVQHCAADRPGARQGRYLAGAGRAPRRRGQPGRRVQALSARGTLRAAAALHLLSQLQQNPGRRLRMDEGDAPAPGAAARHLVHETVAGRPAALQRPVEIGHAVADVVYARAAAREKLRYGAVGVAGLEQLDLNVAQGEADDRSAVGRLWLPRREAEDVTIEGEGGRDAGHGDADVGDAGGGVRHLARQHNECTRGSGGSWQINIRWRSLTPRSTRKSSSTAGSRWWTSGRRGVVRATWWRPSWTSSPGSTRAS